VSLPYTVLARKWRPHRFEDVVGQDVVVRTLRNAIARGRVAHAYLFAGSRGTGKTSVARILARALNCARGPTVDPCGECAPCKEILAGRALDVLEIDGASTRGIDDVRRLREDVKLSPTGGAKKIYIIDEVHMLTPPAFNALLKTLEEPPAHVVFILATTDPQRLPETILSRCQRFNFGRIGARAAAQRLREVVTAEKISITDEALLLLARRSGGALRDALGFLDQIIATGATSIDAAAVVEVLGLVGEDVYRDLLAGIADRDPGRALAIVSDVHRNGHDLEFFVHGLLDLLRALLVQKASPDAAELLEVSGDERERLQELAGRLDLGDVLQLIRILVEAGDRIRRSDHPWVHLEVAVVEMASLDSVREIGELIQELRARSSAPPTPPRPPGGARPGAGEGSPERPAPKAGLRSPRVAPTTEAGSSRQRTERGSSEATAAAEQTIVATFPAEAWQGVLERLRVKKPLLSSILSQGEVGALRGDSLEFRIDPAKAFHIEQLREPAHLDLIQTCIAEVWDRPLGLEVALRPGAGGQASPDADRRKVLEDPLVKRLLEYLDGEIVG
jgi:DNA polymerase-3 subunit gamma/tau